MQYQHLLVDTPAPHVLRVSLNRPECLNALNRVLMQELIAVSAALHDDEQTRVVIFCGMAGNFSSGADIKDMSTTKNNEQSFLLKRRRAGLGETLIHAISGIPQISIAAIQGVALGGAACLASACDFRIGSEDCRIAYPEINLGMNLMWQALPLCVALIGPARAKRMVIGGHQEEAKDLQEWGFLDQVVDTAQLMDAALAMAELYAEKPPIAAQMIKSSVNTLSNTLGQAIMHMDRDQNLLTASTSDREEAMRAFAEKRAAKFTGD
jgi:enoyl-CoA hydratase/carnithine racemase